MSTAYVAAFMAGLLRQWLDRASTLAPMPPGCEAPPNRRAWPGMAGGVHIISLRELRLSRSITRGKHEDEARERAGRKPCASPLHRRAAAGLHGPFAEPAVACHLCAGSPAVQRGRAARGGDLESPEERSVGSAVFRALRPDLSPVFERRERSERSEFGDATPVRSTAGKAGAAGHDPYEPHGAAPAVPSPTPASERSNTPRRRCQRRLLLSHSTTASGLSSPEKLRCIDWR